MVSLNRFSIGIVPALFLLSGPVTGADDLPSDYQLGLGHYARGRWQLAADALARMVADHPQHPRVVDARFYLAESLVRLERYDSALGHFQTLRQHHDFQHCARVLFRCAELAYLDGRLTEAERLFRAFAHRHPGHELNAVALGCLGAIALKQEDPSAALEAYGLALEMFPDPALERERALGIALALELAGDVDGARRFYTHLLAGGDTGVGDRAILRLGLIHIKRHEPAAALALWADFEQRFPNSALRSRIRVARGDALRKLGRFRKAAREIDAVLRHESRDVFTGDALLSRIHIAVAQEDIQAVDVHLRRFRQWLPYSPLLVEAEWAAATFYVRQRQYRLAVQPLQALVRQSIRDSVRKKALAQLVLCQARSGQLQTAAASLDRLLAASASREFVDPIVLELADRCLAAAQIERARTLYCDLISHAAEPRTRAHALFGLTSVQLAVNNEQSAVQTLGRLIDMGGTAPQRARAALLRAELLEQTGQTDEALSAYHRAVELATEPQCRRRAVLRLARFHDDRGRTAQAAEAYRRLVASGAGTDEFDDALFGLAWILKEQGDEAEAFRLFTRIHETLPGSAHWPEATYLLADRAFHAHDVGQASTLLELLLSQTENGQKISDRITSRALYLKGQIAAHREQWNNALETMSLLLRDYSETSLQRPARYWVAEARYRMGFVEQAQSLFRELQLDAQRAQDGAWAARAALRYVQILARRGKWGEALDNARPLLEDFPEFEHRYEVEYVIGRALAARGLLADARRAYQRVVESERGRATETAAMAQWMIGETYMHQKDYRRARREFLAVEILYAFPDWQARALLEAGKCCELMNQWEAAHRHYAELVERYPASSAAEHASRRLRTALRRKDPQ